MAINNHGKNPVTWQRACCDPNYWEQVLKQGLMLDWSANQQVLPHTLHIGNWFHLLEKLWQNVMCQVGSLGMKKGMKKSKDRLVKRWRYFYLPRM